jgi:hypothetical protein
MSLRRFEEGLKEHGLTIEDMKQFRYAGGDEGKHLKNWHKIMGKDKQLPAHEDNCVCGVAIVKNCYITDDKLILVIGSCCIKTFVPTGFTRFCTDCKNPIKSIMDNYCVSCRKINKKKEEEMIKQEECRIEKERLEKEAKERKQKQDELIRLEKEIIYLNVPYIEKDKCKKIGAKWCDINKRWYINGCMNKDLFKEWMPEMRIYLKVSYAEKDKCKILGGHWCNVNKKWYITSENYRPLFKEWDY